MTRAAGTRIAWIAVSVVSLAAVGYWASRQHAPKLPTTAVGGGWLVAALGAYGLSLVLRGWRWHRILVLARIPHERADAFWLMPVTFMGNAVLPLRGGEVLRITLLSSRTTARVGEVIGSVIAERILDVATLAVIFVVLTWSGVDGAPTGKVAASVTAAAVVLAALVFVGYIVLRRRGRFDSFAARIRPYAQASRIFVQPQGLTLAGLSIVIWLLEGATVMLVGRSLGIQLGMLPALLTNVIASLFSALPAGPGYAGSYDAGILLGLHAADVNGGDALGFLLLLRAVVFVPVTLVGLVVLVVRYGGLRRSNSIPLPVES